MRINIYFDLIALISFSLRLSALEFWRDITAHIAAGIHPIKVICKIKQINAVNILPRRKKDSPGKKIAIKVMNRFMH
ncbi:MAG: hypothetical protein A2546_05255 [Sphingobacteriia bacterium RIFOXYD2_FULL_35_12]|nr:MAG: hypothetical protein A2472_09100 [Sphingobacteriia bacterium RIFOXYC2_FULL_35_18]OHC87412.1 MAG: hypothetical protein A2546_05255 [Sphingobacteriia bacterium RIFOXYD2_FULL_35_12]